MAGSCRNGVIGFLSTLSLRRATRQQGRRRIVQKFLSTLSLRRATYGRINDISRLIFLSTLSLRRATTERPKESRSNILFLSTLSLRRATIPNQRKIYQKSNFYPRSPCGERPSKRYPVILGRGISIHALLAESDSKPRALKSRRCVFLSTLSLRRATASQTNLPGEN